MFCSVLSGKTNAVRLLLEAGADVTIGEDSGYTPMHGAHMKMLHRVLMLFAPFFHPWQLSHESFSLSTELFIPLILLSTSGAGFQGRAEIADLLIAHGLSALDMHSDGFTPLHRACWGIEPRHTDTVETFLSSGVPADVLSEGGKTCLDMTTNKRTKKLLRDWTAEKGAQERAAVSEASKEAKKVKKKSEKKKKDKKKREL